MNSGLVLLLMVVVPVVAAISWLVWSRRGNTEGERGTDPYVNRNLGKYGVPQQHPPGTGGGHFPGQG